MKKIILSVCIMFTIFGLACESLAIPNLQIYSPDGTYDTATETWVINSYEYDLWVIGAQRSVLDVKLSFAIPTNESGSIDVTWVDPDKADYGSGNVSSLQLTEDGDGVLIYSAYRDTYASGEPDPLTYGFGVNGTPLMGDGSQVPPHGVFPRDFYEYFIGDFELLPFDDLSNPVFNYIPGSDYGSTAQGEVKKFHINVQGYSTVDIIAYDHVVLGQTKTQYKFTPFSHDGGNSTVPEPATMLLLGLGLIGLAGGRTKCRK